jgi:hypothetical protein
MAEVWIVTQVTLIQRRIPVKFNNEFRVSETLLTIFYMYYVCHIGLQGLYANQPTKGSQYRQYRYRAPSNNVRIALF